MTENILTTPESKEVILGDGNSYKLSVLDLNMMADLEEAFDCPLSKLLDKFDERQALNLRLLLFTLLKENYPKLTLKDVGKLVPLDKMAEIMKTITELLTAGS